MMLEEVQKKIVEGKPVKGCLVKGNTGTGKTIAALHRIIFLKNNYCLYDEDNVLMVVGNHRDKSVVMDEYRKIDKESEFQYITLFSNSKQKVEIISLQELIRKYFQEYHVPDSMKNQEATTEAKIELIKKAIKEHKLLNKKSKFFIEEYADFFLEEISWIKSCLIKTLDQYQNVDRVGRRTVKGFGPCKIPRNSQVRELIYSLMLRYNTLLNQHNLVDYEDILLMISGQIKEDNSNKELFTHILIDDCENTTKAELEFIGSLNRKRTYASVTCFVNKERNFNKNAWFIKGRSAKNLGNEWCSKSILLKKKLEAVKEEEDNIIKSYVNSEINLAESISSIEKYTYCDLRHNRSFSFIRDSGNVEEILVNDVQGCDEYKKDELLEIPVYNDIAAGEPILMSSEQESTFYIPQLWLKGMNNCFILKVKGDSMINANIHDGDYVIIRKQSMAQNNDIVAVSIDGSATLKRLSLKKHSALLLPENENYSPIVITEEGAAILGTAVGIIKNSN